MKYILTYLESIGQSSTRSISFLAGLGQLNVLYRSSRKLEFVYCAKNTEFQTGACKMLCSFRHP